MDTTFLWLEITGRCQLACAHCYADSGPEGSPGAMTTRDWLGVIDEASDTGVRMVQFIGGEPTLHPDLPELVGRAVHYGLAVEIFTNLVHVTVGMWEMFSAPGVRLACSYYSDEPGQHAEVTGRAGSHARTRANIVEALRRSIPLRVGVVDLGHGQRVEQAMAELRMLGVLDVGYDRVRQVGRGLNRGRRGALPQVDELCGQCASGVLAISPEGQVWPCVFSRWLTLGHVRETPLVEIINGRQVTEARSRLSTVFESAGRPCVPKMCDPQCGPRCSPACSPQGTRQPCSPRGGCRPNYE